MKCAGGDSRTDMSSRYAFILCNLCKEHLHIVINCFLLKGGLALVNFKTSAAGSLPAVIGLIIMNACSLSFKSCSTGLSF